MISTRRIVAAVGLAVGVTGLAAPMATAVGSEAHDAGKLNPISTLDSLALSDIPAEDQAELLRPSTQLAGLNRLNDLNQLHQVTDLAAPATGLLGGIES
ncbi:hypothetical protein ACWGKW_08420 [Streptomyces sp. NPDC054766]|uniref:hypothetical protein n=1 Tax=Streptomyces rhizosphaerihabitans TaxID=1266770 RepID=UPI0021BE5B1E|nr:hypothetical protein [Streptomyces rhizosphaerihabitans]MCT9007992.1 hypothetical protein [Streptomyces rhizosphaerihabitans]